MILQCLQLARQRSLPCFFSKHQEKMICRPYKAPGNLSFWVVLEAAARNVGGFVRSVRKSKGYSQGLETVRKKAFFPMVMQNRRENLSRRQIGQLVSFRCLTVEKGRPSAKPFPTPDGGNSWTPLSERRERCRFHYPSAWKTFLDALGFDS